VTKRSTKKVRPEDLAQMDPREAIAHLLRRVELLEEATRRALRTSTAGAEAAQGILDLISDEPDPEAGRVLSLLKAPALEKATNKQTARRARIGRAARRAGMNYEEWVEWCEREGWPEPTRVPPPDWKKRLEVAKRRKK
jgi:hypothetical protein